MKRLLAALLAFFLLIATSPVFARPTGDENAFPIRGFHLDLRIQVMTFDALKDLALNLNKAGINTLVMEWEATYPFEKHPLIPNRNAYAKEQVVAFIKYCNSLGIDVIPLQQSFGHVEYILRHTRYKNLREDQKNHSQVCPLEVDGDRALFTDLYTDLAATHTSKYMHIGGDETYLLGHDERCMQKAAREGKSKLYADYIKMLCDIVIKLGKRPVLWADIALAYPDAIGSLPKEAVLVDWNYGWDLNRFGDHQKLMESGFEIWGAPALRSGPDNYYLTMWEKHFKNIRDFIPAARKLGYKGMVLTSWSTSGVYSPVFESDSDVAELYAVRHVYPLSGFNILIAAYAAALNPGKPLEIDAFIHRYCNEHFGFNTAQSDIFWHALTTSPYEVKQGEVAAPAPMSVRQLLDSNRLAAKALYSLRPLKNRGEFEHFKLMADIRDYYLRYQAIESEVNDASFNESRRPGTLDGLKQLLAESAGLDDRFRQLNERFLKRSEIEEENKVRNIKVKNLYDRLARN